MSMTPEELQRERQRRDSLTVAEQQVQQQPVQQYTIPDLTEEQHEALRKKTFELKDSVIAEQLRLGIIQTENVREMKAELTLLSPPASTLPAMPVDDEQAKMLKLSASKRKKARKRQEDNTKKAQRQNYQSPTGQTLPMAEQIKKQKRQEAKRGPREIENWREIGLDSTVLYHTDLFDPSFDVKKDTSINVGQIRQEIQTAEAVLRQKADSNGEAFNPEGEARFSVLQQTTDAAKAALYAVVGSHGVNSDDGTPLPEEEVLRCRETKDAAIAKYRELVWNRGMHVAKLTYENLQQNEAYREQYAYQVESSRSGLSREHGLSEDTQSRLEAAITTANTETDRTQTRHQLDKRRKNLPYLDELRDSGIEYSSYGAAGVHIDLLRLKAEHADRYAANKALFDRMYAEFLSAEKYVQEREMAVKAVGGATTLDDELFSGQTENNLYNYLVDRNPKMAAADHRASVLMQAMTYLLTGNEDGLSPEGRIALERDFNIVTAKRQEEKDALARLQEMDEHNDLIARAERERLERDARKQTLPPE
ncbi:MAG: hypothetical protein LBQ21_00600 [Clostridiales Family XIII bacterium]|jgi:hypothetical protein|nr:hypothetical protein [Clostridiales Family XIII bacterium]